ncbi:bile acid:sodium symporter family protein [Bremerella alba]|uniref:Pantothenates transporter PanS n=1 Tax=Bremerella alba TaxID=980252 RepID=A0A7V8V344_9BACT|nr:bile acid:sodium symporter family protein [Bremerella alba]MBA2113784.1 Pantothenate precursors transporter PanS [Bremerella alba]
MPHPSWTQLSFTIAVILFAVSGFFLPFLYVWEYQGWQPRQAIGPLVQVIMFGMGVSLTFADFGRVLRMPKSVLVGVLGQFTVMPILAFLFVRLFGLDTEVAAGLILIGSCPGGVASNVIAYIAKANVPLSVTMTACSTMLSPLATPLAMLLLAGQYVPMEVAPMAWSIVKMILIPVLLGLLFNHFAGALVRRLQKLFPLVAMLGICVIIAITIALARDDLKNVGFVLFLAAALQNAVAFTVGYGGARALRLEENDCRTIALEVGIQNGGMATGLAINLMHSPVMALGSAVYGPWSAISSSVLAAWWRSCSPPSSETEDEDARDVTVNCHDELAENAPQQVP